MDSSNRRVNDPAWCYLFVMVSLLRTALLVHVLIASAPGAGPARAQDWPVRPITMVVPFAAGGSVDVMARLFSAALSESLGQAVIVENIGGAGGMTGTARVAKAPPDGYQMVLGSVGTHAQNQSLYKHPPYNVATDFAPVVLMAEIPFVLIARKDLPVANLRDFIAYTKANRAKMQYGSAGVGSASHIACVLLNAAIGVTVTHIPYRASPAAMQDMLAGLIDYQCTAVAVALPQIESNEVKSIAVLTADRSPMLPGLPSAQEQGLTGFEFSNWYAIFLPRGTPAEIVRKLHDATIQAMNTPSVQARLRQIGGAVVAPERRSTDYLARFVTREIDKWAAVFRASGVAAQ